MKSRSNRRSVFTLESLEAKRLLSVNPQFPVVEITSPTEGQVLPASQIVQFTGVSSDEQDGDISSRLSWTSSQSGFLGAGSTIETSLSAGLHTISARSTDTDGFSTVDSHVVTVIQTGSTSPILGARGKSWGLQPTVPLDGATSISSSTLNQVVAQFDDPQFAPPQLTINHLGSGIQPIASLAFWNGKIAIFQTGSSLASGSYLLTVSGDTLTKQTSLTILAGNDATEPVDDAPDGDTGNGSSDGSQTDNGSGDSGGDNPGGGDNGGGNDGGSDNGGGTSEPVIVNTLLARNRETVVSTDEIEVQVRYVNETGATQNLNGAEVRYYFTPDGLTPVVKVKGSNAEVSTGFEPSGSYAAVKVTEDLLLGPNDSWRFRLEIESDEGSNFNQANDASFLGDQTNLGPTDLIDLVFANGTDTPADPSEPSEPDPPPASSASALELIYLNKERNSDADVIEAQIELFNKAEEERNYRNMELRYFINADGLTPSVDVTRSNVSGIQSSYNQAGGYVSFLINQDFVVEPGKRLKLRFTISNSEGQLFDQTNDASYSSTVGRFVSDQIDVWLNGQRLWGA